MTSRDHALRRALLTTSLAALVLAGGVRAAAADKTTLGGEWELYIGVDLARIAELTADPADPAVKVPTYKADYDPAKAAVRTRLLCTTARQPGGFPLVSLTWDMGELERTLEIVSGPIEHDDAATWEQARTFIDAFHRVLTTACADKAFMVGSMCAVPLPAVLTGLEKELPGAATADCYAGDASKNLRAKAIPDVRLNVRAPVEQTIYGGMGTGITSAATQVSIGVDLDTFVTSDLTALYGRRNVGGMAYQYARTKLLSGLGGLTAAQQTFVALYFIELQVFVEYLTGYHGRRLATKVDLSAEGNSLSALLATTPISDRDSVRLKNLFSLLPKTSLATLYAHLVATDPNRDATDEARRFPRAVFAGRDDAYFCDPEFIRAYQTADDPFQMHVNPGIVDTIAAACRDLHSKFWQRAIVAGQDPIGLDKIAGSVFPIVTNPGDGKARVVFEMRDGTDLISARSFRVTPEKRIDWRGPIALPAGLP